MPAKVRKELIRCYCVHLYFRMHFLILFLTIFITIDGAPTNENDWHSQVAEPGQNSKLQLSLSNDDMQALYSNYHRYQQQLMAENQMHNTFDAPQQLAQQRTQFSSPPSDYINPSFSGANPHFQRHESEVGNNAYGRLTAGHQFVLPPNAQMNGNHFYDGSGTKGPLPEVEHRFEAGNSSHTFENFGLKQLEQAHSGEFEAGNNQLAKYNHAIDPANQPIALIHLENELRQNQSNAMNRESAPKSGFFTSPSDYTKFMQVLMNEYKKLKYAEVAGKGAHEINRKPSETPSTFTGNNSSHIGNFQAPPFSEHQHLGPMENSANLPLNSLTHQQLRQSMNLSQHGNSERRIEQQENARINGFADFANTNPFRLGNLQTGPATENHQFHSIKSPENPPIEVSGNSPTKSPGNSSKNLQRNYIAGMPSISPINSPISSIHLGADLSKDVQQLHQSGSLNQQQMGKEQVALETGHGNKFEGNNSVYESDLHIISEDQFHSKSSVNSQAKLPANSPIMTINSGINSSKGIHQFHRALSENASHNLQISDGVKFKGESSAGHPNPGPQSTINKRKANNGKMTAFAPAPPIKIRYIVDEDGTHFNIGKMHSLCLLIILNIIFLFHFKQLLKIFK